MVKTKKKDETERIEEQPKRTVGEEIADKEAAAAWDAEMAHGEEEDLGTDWNEIAVLDTPGDFIVGEYAESYPGVGKNKSAMHVILVDDRRIGVWGSTTLDRSMSRAVVGDRIGIRFRGMEKPEGAGRAYKVFEVKRLKN